MPPKALPARTIATREFFGTDETDAPSHDELESASPSLSPEVSASTGEGKSGEGGKGKGKEGEENKGEERREPSPTPSDIVLQADLEDMGALSDLNAQMVRDGVGVEERKEGLRGLQERLVEGREKRFSRREGDGDAK